MTPVLLQDMLQVIAFTLMDVVVEFDTIRNPKTVQSECRTIPRRFVLGDFASFTVLDVVSIMALPVLVEVA